MISELAKKAAQVVVTFAKIDRATQQFAEASSLSCPASCGKCCENPNIETTILDMLPLALQLKNENRLEAIAEQAAQATSLRCIFFENEGSQPGQGRCMVYRYRPSICRLFGFAATRTKHEVVELAACKIHKQTQPATVEAVQQASAKKQINVPLFVEYSNQLSEIDPVLAVRHYQINHALLLAIEKAALLPS